MVISKRDYRNPNPKEDKLEWINETPLNTNEKQYVYIQFNSRKIVLSAVL